MGAVGAIPEGKPWGRRGAPSPDERRARLVSAAEETFLERGYAAASTDDIAVRAGMSKRTLYTVFPSKAALFESVVRAVLAEDKAVGIDKGEADPAKAAGDYLFAVARGILSDRRMGLLRLVVAESPRSPELSEVFFREVRGGGPKELADWLAGLEAEGRVSVGDCADAALMLFGMAVGHPHMLRLAGGERIAEDVLRARIDRAVSIFLRGLA
jgi:AcrR family transcriptional regulator